MLSRWLKLLLVVLALPGVGCVLVAREGREICEEDDTEAAKAIAERRAQPARIDTADRPRVAAPKRDASTIEATLDACARMHLTQRPRRMPPPEPPSHT